MTTREYYGILSCGEAYHAFTLCLIRDISCRIVYAIDIVHFEDRVVILYIKLRGFYLCTYQELLL